MHEFKVLATRDLDFKDDEGRPVKGTQLWVLGQTNDPAWSGHEVLKLWFAHDNPLVNVVKTLRLEDAILVSFNRRGKPETIEKV